MIELLWVQILSLEYGQEALEYGQLTFKQNRNLFKQNKIETCLTTGTATTTTVVVAVVVLVAVVVVVVLMQQGLLMLSLPMCTRALTPHSETVGSLSIQGDLKYTT